VHFWGVKEGAAAAAGVHSRTYYIGWAYKYTPRNYDITNMRECVQIIIPLKL